MRACNIKFGCSLYFFSFIKVPFFYLFLKQCKNKMIDNGLAFCEIPVWNTFTVREAKEIRKIVEPEILSISVHLPKDMGPEKVLEAKELLNGIFELHPEIAVIHIPLNRFSIGAWYKLRDVFRNAGCDLCIEYLPYSSESAFIYELDNVPLVLDFYHCANGGKSIENVISHFSSRIHHVHLNDFSQQSTSSLCPGDGELDLQKYVDMLSEIGYKGFYMLEGSCQQEERCESIISFCKSLERRNNET